MERSPRQGAYRSPWAVKKVARRFATNGGSQDFSRRLLQEAEILRSLEHPNIIGYRTLTKAQDGAWCLAMERAHHWYLQQSVAQFDFMTPHCLF